MTAAELRQRWEHRRDEWSRLGVSVDGGKLAAEVLADIDGLTAEDAAALYTPTEAAARAGYHPESICRLIRKGTVKNYGTKRRPRVKLSEIPRKAVGQRAAKPVVAKNSHRGESFPDAIARDAIAGRIGR